MYNISDNWNQINQNVSLHNPNSSSKYWGLQFAHCLSYLLLCNKLPQNISDLTQHLLSHSFSGSRSQAQLAKHSSSENHSRLQSLQGPTGKESLPASYMWMLAGLGSQQAAGSLPPVLMSLAGGVLCFLVTCVSPQIISQHGLKQESVYEREC